MQANVSPITEMLLLVGHESRKPRTVQNFVCSLLIAWKGGNSPDSPSIGSTSRPCACAARMPEGLDLFQTKVKNKSPIKYLDGCPDV